jgi:hypothetical protein
VIKDDEVGNGRLKRNIGMVWVGKPEEKRPFERPRRRGKDKNKMCHKEIG